MNRLARHLIIIICLILSGCAGAAFDNAAKTDTISSYEQFLAEYPDSKYSFKAKKRINEIAFEKAQQENTSQSFESFLKNHPNSRFSLEANKKIEIFVFKKAQKENSIELYKQFLIDYPKSKFAKEAKSKIIELAWQEAITTNTIEGYKSFLREHPITGFIIEANAKIVEIAWQGVKAKNTIAEYERFLKDYPHNKFIKEVKDKIVEVAWQEAEAKNTLAGYEHFLSDYKSNKFTNDAKLKISELNKKDIQNSIKNFQIILTKQKQKKYTFKYRLNIDSALSQNLTMEKIKEPKSTPYIELPKGYVFMIVELNISPLKEYEIIFGKDISLFDAKDHKITGYTNILDQGWILSSYSKSKCSKPEKLKYLYVVKKNDLHKLKFDFAGSIFLVKDYI